MKHRERKPVMGIALALLSVMFCTASLAAMPQGEFACKVRAQGGRIGLVMVQADTRAMAEESAMGAEALTTDNTRSSATRVVQCVRLGEERFSDYQFQQFVESLPM